MIRNLSERLGLYLVVGGCDNQHGVRALDIVAQAVAGGVTTVQWRDKKMAIRQSLELAGAMRDLCRQFGVMFIVNDRIDLALLLAADGVHLGQDDVPLMEARRVLGDQCIIGVSTGTFAEAQQAERDGADYVGVGAIYATATKQDAGEPIGTSLISQIDRQLRIPQVGIGGIHADNAVAVLQAGAEGIAVVSAITESLDVQNAAYRLKEMVKSHT
jgi:thiamine-phosphate pyrophosphorylase